MMSNTRDKSNEKLVAGLSEGWLTESEVAKKLLLELSTAETNQAACSQFAKLPKLLQTTVITRLSEFEKNGFNWQPFVIGTGFSKQEIEMMNSQLKSLYDEIERS